MIIGIILLVLISIRLKKYSQEVESYKKKLPVWIVNLHSKLLLPKVQVLQLFPLVELGGGG